MPNYDEDDDEIEGPRSSFETYLSEGDALYKNKEYHKALESYSMALQLQSGDKVCLVARSKCYLTLGDPKNALADADAAIKTDKKFVKALYRKAEALYSVGQFEYALMYYHRGHRLRSELDEFRLGIQKAQEAINNSIGTAANIELEIKGDLSFFTEKEETVKPKPRNPMNAKKLQAKSVRKKEDKGPTTSKKTVKQLLGELYFDKEYLEKLMKDDNFIQNPKNSEIYDLVEGGIKYLETRTDFWRQQKPLYSRRKQSGTVVKNRAVRKNRNIGQTYKYIETQLEQAEDATITGKSDVSYDIIYNLLRYVRTLDDDFFENKRELVVDVKERLRKAYHEMSDLAACMKEKPTVTKT